LHEANILSSTMNLKSSIQSLKFILLDCLLVGLSLYMAFALRFNFTIPRLYFHQFLISLPAFVILRCVLYSMFDVYRIIPRYASTSDFLAIFKATALGTIIIALINGIVPPFVPAVSWLYEHEGHLQRLSWPVIIIEFALTLLLVGGARFIQRAMHLDFPRRKQQKNLRRVLIVGAGDAGEAVARQMRISPLYQAVGFIDDDPQKVGRLIHGLPVLGTTSDIPKIIEAYGIDEVLVAIPGIKPADLNRIIGQCEHARVGFRILPSVHDILSGRVALERIRAVEIEDLLEREEIELTLPPEKNYIKDEVVLITGAGGSIGSELCRQVLRLQPRRVLLLGHGENSIYEITTELARQVSSDKLIPLIGDIRDFPKLRKIFQTFRPTVVFHAAAHKHVPLMEYHADEAIKNNIIGTLNVARLADEFGAKRFILISSDKAVRPTNVMGASKRVAEMIVFCLAKHSRTLYAAVRFGNVLGSRGSVIPLFRRQIAAGGPVTLTHPEVTRYFMTIPEAVSLVIKAGSMDDQGRVYVLDMGKPVKIADLARRLIQLSGFEPDIDIKIEFTGLRPGEKLTEELLTAGENVKATEIGKIFTAQPDDVDCDKLWKEIAELEKLAYEGNGTLIRERLKKLVPEYTPQPEPKVSPEE